MGVGALCEDSSGGAGRIWGLRGRHCRGANKDIGGIGGYVGGKCYGGMSSEGFLRGHYSAVLFHGGSHMSLAVGILFSQRVISVHSRCKAVRPLVPDSSSPFIADFSSTARTTFRCASCYSMQTANPSAYPCNRSTSHISTIAPETITSPHQA